MPGRDYSPFTDYNFVTLLEFIFQGDLEAQLGLARLTSLPYPRFVPYLPRDHGRRERLLNGLRMLHESAAAAS